MVNSKSGEEIPSCLANANLEGHKPNAKRLRAQRRNCKGLGLHVIHYCMDPTCAVKKCALALRSCREKSLCTNFFDY